MPHIKEQKRKFKIQFGDSIDWPLVDFDCVLQFLLAAYNKVEINALNFTDFLKKEIKNDSKQTELLKKNTEEEKNLFEIFGESHYFDIC